MSLEQKAGFQQPKFRIPQNLGPVASIGGRLVATTLFMATAISEAKPSLAQEPLIPDLYKPSGTLYQDSGETSSTPTPTVLPEETTLPELTATPTPTPTPAESESTENAESEIFPEGSETPQENLYRGFVVAAYSDPKPDSEEKPSVQYSLITAEGEQIPAGNELAPYDRQQIEFYAYEVEG